jgi:hypothetical protein
MATTPVLEYKGEGAYYTAGASEVVSGGQFLKGDTGSPTTAHNSITMQECCDVLLANAAHDQEAAIGMAMNNAASGELVTVCTEGFFRIHAGAAATAGLPFRAECSSGSAFAARLAEKAALGAGSYVAIGRALNTASANQKFWGLLRI